MKLLEVRDCYIKFSLETNLPVSAFVEVNDFNKNYLAQILKISKTEDSYVAYAELVFVYDGTIKEYDKTTPSLEAEIKEFNFDLIQKAFEPLNPIFIGKFSDKKTDFFVEKDCFDKNILISVDTEEKIETIIKNFSKQFKNTVVIDTLGIVKSEKFSATKDFKLPLNTSSLQFLYEDCLNEATIDSKNLIKDIFNDLAIYSKTVPFLPFDALRSIISDMVDNQHIFKLLVLKNKLNKFDTLKYFATNSAEVDSLKDILCLENSVIDLSKLDNSFQNRYLMYIYEKMESLDTKPQVFVITSNLLNKKSLKKCLTSEISTSLITFSNFKYLNDIRTMFSNFIVEPNFRNNEIFKTYSNLLKLNIENMCLVVGECTKNLPILTQLSEFVGVSKSIENVVIEEKNFEQIENSIVLEEVNSSVVAIDKKSDELIEKVVEEVALENEQPNIDLFIDDSEAENESLERVSSIEQYSSEAELIKELTKEEFSVKSNDVIEEVVDIVEINSINEEPEENLDLNDNDTSEMDEEFSDLTIDETPLEQVYDEDIENNIEADSELIEIQNDEPDNLESEFHTKVDEFQTVEIPEDIIDLTEEVEDIDVVESPDFELVSEVAEDYVDENDLNPIEVSEIEDFNEVSDEINDEISEEKIPDIIPISFEEDDITEFEELNPEEALDTDIIVEFDDDLTSDNLNREIVEDVDKVFTTIKEDNISDSDLDFIDELNNSVNENVDVNTYSDGIEEMPEFNDLENDEDSFVEPLAEMNDVLYEEQDSVDILETKSSSTPIVPVYDAEIPQEDTVLSDDIEQGDTVVHAKYGNGVVEKMIKYGSKTLFSINFDNLGRRLLDPTLTEIKKS